MKLIDKIKLAYSLAWAHDITSHALLNKIIRQAYGEGLANDTASSIVREVKAQKQYYMRLHKTKKNGTAV